MSYCRINIVISALIYLLLLFGFRTIYACDMSALIAKDGFSLNFNSNSNNFTAPADYITFIKNRSSSIINYDGYGVFFYKQNSQFTSNNSESAKTLSEAWYQTGMQTYYTKAPPKVAADWQWEMDAALTSLQTAQSGAEIVLSHARRGTGGSGNHPFRFVLHGKTYSFMHNGSIGAIKDLLFAQTFGDPAWRSAHPSNWAPQSSTNSADYIDSEVFFHWLMKNIIDSDGSVLMGLRKSLAYPVPGLNNAEGNTIHDNLSRNKLNFVFSDGEMLYVYRGTPESGTSYNLSYKDNKSFWGIKTQEDADGIPIMQHQLVCLSKFSIPMVFSNFSNPEIEPDCFIKSANQPVSGLKCLISDVNLTAGKTLLVKANSILEIGNKCRINLQNAKLIIEENAELRLGNGSEIIVDGNRSALIINGGGRLSGYRAQQDGQNGDLVVVKNGGQLRIGDNSKRSIIYSRSSQKWSGFKISSVNLSEDYFINCDISDLSVILADNQAVNSMGNLSIVNCKLKNLNSLMINNINQLSLFDSKLENFGYSGLNIFASGAKVSNCVITGSEFDAVEANYNSRRDLRINGNLFKQNLGHGINIFNRAVSSISQNQISENKLNGVNLKNALPLQKRAAITNNRIANNGRTEFSALSDDYRLIYNGENSVSDMYVNSAYRPNYLMAIMDSTGRKVNVSGNHIPQYDYQNNFYPAYELFDFQHFSGLISIIEDKLNSALMMIENRSYDQARIVLEQLVVDYKNSNEAKSALIWLLNLEKIDRHNFPLFRSFIDSLTPSENSPLGKHLKEIIISSYLAETDFKSALPLLQQNINTTSSKSNKIRSMMDMAYCQYNILSKNLAENSFIGYSVALENSSDFLPCWYKLKNELNQLAIADSGSLSIENNLPAIVSEDNYPNPFNSATTIRFKLNAESKVRLTIFNISGQQVHQFDFGKITQGSHTYRWNAGNQNLASGLYYYRIEADNFSTVSRMMLVK